jgi:hypothetical protein
LLASSAGNPRFCGAMNPGRLFFGSFLLAKQKKGRSMPPTKSRRATPGLTNDSPLLTTKSTFGANRFAQRVLQFCQVAAQPDLPNLLACVILHNEKQIPRQTRLGMTVHFLCAPKNNHAAQTSQKIKTTPLSSPHHPHQSNSHSALSAIPAWS